MGDCGVAVAIATLEIDDFSCSVPLDDQKPVCSDFDNFLNRPQVRIKNRSVVSEKLRRISKDGADKMMVISDFDFTLTKFMDAKGNRYWSSPGVFDYLAEEINPELAIKYKILCKKYIPIEFDPHLSMEEKIPHMEMFWRLSHQYTVDGRFSKKMIEDFVLRSKIELRDGCVEMLKQLQSRSVPVVVFSAGVADVIDVFMRDSLAEETLPENMHIISNVLEYDDKGILSGFSDPLIHTFCKNSSVIQKEAAFFHQIRERTNVVLLGDSLGDTDMDVGVEKHGETLKIGFLNYKVEDLLEHYLEIYDIVLVGDWTMDVPSAIIDLVMKGA